MKFTEFKVKFNDVNKELKQRLAELGRIKGELDKNRVEDKQEKKKRVESMLKSKEEMVQDKIKNGGKLTTEDLLIFQGMPEKK